MAVQLRGNSSYQEDLFAARQQCFNGLKLIHSQNSGQDVSVLCAMAMLSFRLLNKEVALFYSAQVYILSPKPSVSRPKAGMIDYLLAVRMTPNTC